MSFFLPFAVVTKMNEVVGRVQVGGDFAFEA